MQRIHSSESRGRAEPRQSLPPHRGLLPPSMANELIGSYRNSPGCEKNHLPLRVRMKGSFSARSSDTFDRRVVKVRELGYGEPLMQPPRGRDSDPTALRIASSTRWMAQVFDEPALCPNASSSSQGDAPAKWGRDVWARAFFSFSTLPSRPERISGGHLVYSSIGFLKLES